MHNELENIKSDTLDKCDGLRAEMKELAIFPKWQPRPPLPVLLNLCREKLWDRTLARWRHTEEHSTGRSPGLFPIQGSLDVRGLEEREESYHFSGLQIKYKYYWEVSHLSLNQQMFKRVTLESERQVPQKATH